MTSVQLRLLSEHVGVEATGVDLNALDDAVFGSLREAVAEHGILFVRDQELTPEQHIAFARRWGAIDVNKYFPANGGHPEIAEPANQHRRRLAYRPQL
jgi:taurine dioxygenase